MTRELFYDSLDFGQSRIHLIDHELGHRTLVECRRNQSRIGIFFEVGVQHIGCFLPLCQPYLGEPEKKLG